MPFGPRLARRPTVRTKSHAFATTRVRPCRLGHARNCLAGEPRLRLALQRRDVAVVVDLAADQRVAPGALAVLGRVVAELVACIAERGDAGEVIAEPVVGAAALPLLVVTRAREVLHAEEAAHGRAAGCERPAEGRHRRALERAADACGELGLAARAPAFDRREAAVIAARGAETARRLAPDANGARVRVEGPVVALDARVDVVLDSVCDVEYELAVATAGISGGLSGGRQGKRED